jgi:5-methylcytosine-specific restriction endonuclease McrA
MNKPCIKGTSTDRKPNGDCRPCALLRDREYKQKNKERLLQQAKDYYDRNKEKINAANKNWRITNADRKNEYDRNWKAANSELLKKHKRDHYDRNTDRIKQRAKDWVANNAEYVKVRQREYFKKNPEIRVNAKAKRRTRVGTYRLPYGTIPALYKSQNGLCACCRKELNGKYHVDHIMPLALGGRNIPENLQLLLPRCNLKKGKSHPDIWKSKIKETQSP